MIKHVQFDTATALIDSGDTAALKQLLADHPDLANSRGDDNLPLIVHLIDWPGHRPNATETARVLLEAGAEVDARRNEENGTALAGALCTEEIDVVRVLLEGGADIHAPLGWMDGTVLEFAERICENETRSDEPKMVELSRLFSEAADRTIPQRPKIGGPTPIIFVKNVDAAMDYYRNVLGFAIDWEVDLESDCGGKYVGLSRGACELHMALCHCEVDRHTGNSDVRISTSNVDALFEEMKAAGVNVRFEPANQPWGFREFDIEDPDGNRFSFYGPENEDEETRQHGDEG